MSSNSKKRVVVPLLNDARLVAVIGGVIGALLAGLILFYFFEHGTKQIAKTTLMDRVSNADELLKLRSVTAALHIYKDVLRTFSKTKYPNIYVQTKNNQGTCHQELARMKDKEENLTKAIRAHEEALGIRTGEKYPANYATTQNNLGNAYRVLAEEL